MNTVKDAASAPAEKGKKKAEEADYELDGLMSEIETDLREEELKKIWRNYGGLIVVLAVAVILGVAGVQFYRSYDAKQRDAAARQYEAAIKAQEEGKSDDAEAMFKKLAEDGPRGYGTLARLAEASIQLQKKDIDGALANYKALSNDSKADPVFRDLGTLLFVLHSLDRADPKALEEQLTPLTSPNNAFNPSALELTALLAAKQGDTARAIKTLGQITADPSAPTSMRQRAEDLTKLYEAGIVPPPPAAPAMPSSVPSSAPSPAPEAAPPADAPAADAAPKP